MAKLDRLVRLAKLRRRGRPLTIRKMSEACRVSERTIYRYLNTLGDIDVEGSFRKPARGALAAQLRPLALTVDDLELAEYAFQECVISGCPCLRRRLRKVSRALAIIVDQAGVVAESRFVHRKRRPLQSWPASLGRGVEKFLKAGGEGRLVDVCTRLSGTKLRLSPVRLVIDEGDVTLEFVDPVDEKLVSMKVHEIAGIRLVRHKGKTG